MPHDFQKPRILFVTPEVSYLPEKMSAMPTSLKARAGELADFSAALISSLYKKGVDIHVALPDYRTLFNNNGHEPTWSISTQAQPTSKNGSNLVTYCNFNRNESSLCRSQLSEVRSRDRETRVHLANDRIFFNKEKIYSDFDQENIKSSLSFQREVINTIIRRVQPDLIHCNDWMTGLIPAIARKLGIPCLFTIHNVYNNKALLSYIEDRGIDAAYFWQNLFFEHQPLNYEETRSSNPVDFLASGIFAAHFVNTTCPEFLKEIIQGQHPLVTPSVKQELLNKVAQGYASGISNSPDGSRLPKNLKNHQISRIMKQSHEMFDHAVTVEQYLLLYEKMLKRPVCESMEKKGDAIKWFNDSKKFGFFAQEGGGPDVFLHQSETKKFG